MESQPQNPEFRLSPMQLSIGVECLAFGRNFHVLPYLFYASMEGSHETG